MVPSAQVGNSQPGTGWVGSGGRLLLPEKPGGSERQLWPANPKNCRCRDHILRAALMGALEEVAILPGSPQRLASPAALPCSQPHWDSASRDESSQSGLAGPGLAADHRRAGCRGWGGRGGQWAGLPTYPPQKPQLPRARVQAQGGCRSEGMSVLGFHGPYPTGPADYLARSRSVSRLGARDRAGPC